MKAVFVKVSKALGLLKHAIKFNTKGNFKNSVHSIVEPHFRYCCSVWGCAGATKIKQLQRLQNHAARIVTNCSNDTPSKNLFWKNLTGRPLTN